MIHSIRVKNFKSIADTGLIKLVRINAFIGKNGAGKTNIIYAIRLFKKLSEGEKLSNILKDVAPMDVEFFKWGNFSNRASFEFEIESTSGKRFVYKFVITNSIGGFTHTLGISEEYLAEVNPSTKTSEMIFHREIDKITYGSDADRELTGNIDYDKSFLSGYKNNNNSAQDLIKTVLGYWFIDEHLYNEPGIRVVNLNSISSSKIDDVVVSLYIKNLTAFSKAVEVLKKILEKFEAPIVNTIADAGEKVDKINPSEKKLQNFYYVLWQSRLGGGSHTYQSLSGGERRIIHLVFSLFSTFPRSLFVVEEIENGIHFGIIRRLMDEFKTQAYNHKTQVLFTTHSSEVMCTLVPQEVVWVRNQGENGTTAVTLTDTEEYTQVKKDINEDMKEAVMSGMFDN